MTDEQKQQIIRLRKKGCGYTAVANKVGISKDTVKSFCRRNGLAGEIAAAQGDSVPGYGTAGDKDLLFYKQNFLRGMRPHLCEGNASL